MCYSCEENSVNEMEDDSVALTLLVPPAGRLASRERGGDVTAAARRRRPPPSQLVGPRDKFDFAWRPFPDSQIDPDLRRESFAQRESIIPFLNAVPYRAFTGIWDYHLMQHIAKATNEYAAQLAAEAAAAGAGTGARGPAPARTAWWQDTTTDELYTYFAIIIAMGTVVETNIKEYWNKCESLLHTPGFPTTMPHDRFVLLSKCIRYASDIYDTQEMSPSQAKIAKIQPVIDHFNWKYEERSKLSRNIVIHEGQSESDLILLDNQFFDDETSPVIKTHEVCDSLTGYLWRFEIQGLYEDHIEQPHAPVSGSMPSLVFRLLDGVGLGHTVWLEDASPALARELKSRGLDCAGPLRGPRGAGGGARGCTAGDVDLVVCSSDVMISTYHGAAGGPRVAADYERHRRARQPAPRPDERRTNVWYRKLLRKLLNDSVSNLYVLYKAETGKSCRAFKRRLVGDLLAKHSRAQTPLPYTVQHFPARISRISGLRRLCIVCKQPTEWLCKNCQLLMCVEDCFEEYHAEEIKQPDRRFWH
ncbi:piggyBac transposable element-derived protein 4 isoform X2 [Plutella xylostella]|nr:piggyBac transposable element-derived protein 4 isoform X2 [Plutella xylostella]